MVCPVCVKCKYTKKDEKLCVTFCPETTTCDECDELFVL